MFSIEVNVLLDFPAFRIDMDNAKDNIFPSKRALVKIIRGKLRNAFEVGLCKSHNFLYVAHSSYDSSM